MRDRIHRKVKKITIREGHRDYKPGQTVMLSCHVEPWAVQVKITTVKHCMLGEVTSEEYLADGFESKARMLEGMRKFYPALGWESPVTVIRWKDACGYWVDNPDLYNELFPFEQ